MRINKKFFKVTRGSLTVEAALVLPVFIYIIIAFMYFLQIIRIQENLQSAITEAGINTAKYAYVYDYLMDYGDDKAENENTKEQEVGFEEVKEEEPEEESKEESKEESEENKKSKIEESVEAVIARGIDSTYYKIKMRDYLDVNKIDHSCIENGFEGVHTYLSSFMKEEDAIDIILIYNIKLPLLFINLEDIPVMQRVRLRGWNGHKVAAKNSPSQTEEDDQEMVYITETGTVYHLFKDCSHLALSIKEADFNHIDNLRNDSGGKYKKCSLCGDNGENSGYKTVYITNTGDRYHWDLNCSGLKRTIITIPKSQVGDRNLCTRCAAKNK